MKIIEEKTRQHIWCVIKPTGDVANMEVDARLHDKGGNSEEWAVMNGFLGMEDVEDLNRIEVITEEENTTRWLLKGSDEVNSGHDYDHFIEENVNGFIGGVRTDLIDKTFVTIGNPEASEARVCTNNEVSIAIIPNPITDGGVHNVREPN